MLNRVRPDVLGTVECNWLPEKTSRPRLGHHPHLRLQLHGSSGFG